MSNDPKAKSSSWTVKQQMLLYGQTVFLKLLVGRGGLEPPTSRLSGVRSNHLSYRPNEVEVRDFSGGAYRDRTDDPLLAKQVLSQLS
jgi:hypothetical protein